MSDRVARAYKARFIELSRPCVYPQVELNPIQHLRV